MPASKIYIYIHLIWSTKKEAPRLSGSLRRVLFPQIKQHAEARGLNVIVINGMDDHIHCLIKLLPVQNVTDSVKFLKTFSASWLNESKIMKEPFEWPDEYWGYSVSPNNIDKVTDYINGQEEYHRTRSFDEEMDMINQLNPGSDQ